MGVSVLGGRRGTGAGEVGMKVGRTGIYRSRTDGSGLFLREGTEVPEALLDEYVFEASADAPATANARPAKGGAPENR